MKYWFLKVLLVTMVAFLFTGCAIKFSIKDPVVSNLKYDKGSKKSVVLQVIDRRSNMVFHERLGALSHGNIELDNITDPVAWLSQALEKEFSARNIPVQVVYGNTNKPADIVLTVKKFQVVSRRALGSEYNPWETYHSFRGEVTTGRKTADIRAYFFNGKVPWTWKEVEETCFNMPLSLLVKDRPRLQA